MRGGDKGVKGCRGDEGIKGMGVYAGYSEECMSHGRAEIKQRENRETEQETTSREIKRQRA